MGLFTKIRRSLFRADDGRTPLGDASDPRWYTDPATGFGWYGGTADSAGMHVTPTTADRVSAVFRCVALLSGSVAQLPLIVYRRTDDEGKERAKKHPLFYVLGQQTNASLTSFEWRELVMADLLLWGNHYSRIISGPLGPISELDRFEPGRMKVEKLENRRRRYTYRHPSGREETLTQDEVFHVMGPSRDGITGLGPVGLMRTTIGAAMAQEQFGAKQFSRKPQMAGLLEAAAGNNVTGDQMKATGESFRAAHSGPDAWHSVAVLPPGYKWAPQGMSNEDAQFLESRQFSVTDIARWFGVPPHMVGDLTRATFSNIEHQGIDYVTHALMPWLRRIEGAILRDLVLEPETIFAEFLVDALLRGDALSRAQTDAIYLDRGVKVPNEVRVRENMNPREGGDKPITPQGQRAPGEDPATFRRPEPKREPEEDEDAEAAAPHNRLNGHARRT